MAKCLFLLICAALYVVAYSSKITEVFENEEADEFDESGYLSEAMREALKKVNRAVKRTESKWKKKDVWDEPMTLFQFFKQPPSEESARMAMAGDVFECALDLMKDKVKEKFPHRLKRRVNATDMLSAKTIAELIKFTGCKANLPPPKCPNDCFNRMYRTYSAMCNNEDNPAWGAGNIPLARWRPSIYENRFSTPVGWEKDRLYNSFKLPLVRKVSNDALSTKNSQVTEDPDYSHMMVVWGQYIDHDLDLTPQSLSTSTFQGLTDCSKTCQNQSPCYPMLVPEDDPRIKDAKCLPFFRSASVCGTGDTSSLFQNLLPREQINAATSFVDASTVYGSSAAAAINLRNISHDESGDAGKHEGLMKINTKFYDVNGKSYLPFNLNMPCVQDPFDASGENINCFLAGDPRASEHLTLSAIHTLWVREHNRIARMLKEINPHWAGDILYQEARKIVGAYHQVVNWKEYVPKIIGPTGMRRMGPYEGYKPDENPTISNVFATAAFRFGHVTIAPEFRRLDENFEDHPQFPSILLHEAFFSPWRMVKQGGIDPILRGLIGRPAKLLTSSQIMHEELREKLFALQNKIALDLASLNLQRGRDHALPLYNDWREECGLPRAQNFSQVANEIRNATLRSKLRQLYGHPGNIDVWMAGLAEDLEPGSRLGPVFNCLISRQFKFLRNGDRFYYENPGVFTEQQRDALNQMRFSRVICDNSGLTHVQRDVFELANYPDDFVSCDNIPSLDLSLWKENPEVGSCGIPPDIEHGYWKKCDTGVMYGCTHNTMLIGESYVQCVDGEFSPSPPTCQFINMCENKNGNCEEMCEPDKHSVVCSCYEGRRLKEDGMSCENIPPMNVQAVVLGVVLGLAVLVAVLSLGVLVYKFIQLRSQMQYRRTGLFNLDKQPNAFENPAMKPETKPM